MKDVLRHYAEVGTLPAIRFIRKTIKYQSNNLKLTFSNDKLFFVNSLFYNSRHDILDWTYQELQSNLWKDKQIREDFLNAAARQGHLKLLQDNKSEIKPNLDLCINAAAGNHFDVVKWAFENGCHIASLSRIFSNSTGLIKEIQSTRHYAEDCASDVCMFAALNGNMEMLQWARNNRSPWDERTMCAAARGGYLDVLKWLRENNCPWDSRVYAFGLKGDVSRETLDAILNQKT